MDEIRISVLIPRKHASDFKELAREFRLEQRGCDPDSFWDCIWWIAHRARCVLEDGQPSLKRVKLNKFLTSGFITRKEAIRTLGNFDEMKGIGK